MSKFIKLIGFLAVLVSSIAGAAASTFTSKPFIGTGGNEDFVFSYSTTAAFTLSSLSFAAPPGGNLLAGTLLPFTTATGGSLNGTGTLSEIISTTLGKSYTASFDINSLPTGSLSVSVSPVPLPASLPLFVVALIGLMLIGYRTGSTSGRPA